MHKYKQILGIFSVYTFGACLISAESIANTCFLNIDEKATNKFVHYFYCKCVGSTDITLQAPGQNTDCHLSIKTSKTCETSTVEADIDNEVLLDDGRETALAKSNTNPCRPSLLDNLDDTFSTVKVRCSLHDRKSINAECFYKHHPDNGSGIITVPLTVHLAPSLPAYKIIATTAKIIIAQAPSVQTSNVGLIVAIVTLILAALMVLVILLLDRRSRRKRDEYAVVAANDARMRIPVRDVTRGTSRP